MHRKRTEGWYLTRLELADAIAFILIAAMLVPRWFEPTFDARPGGYVAASLFVAAAAFLGMLFGLAWMIRIFRGPHDEPPPWRYRDR
jgi:hypothetical protein